MQATWRSVRRNDALPAAPDRSGSCCAAPNEELRLIEVHGRKGLRRFVRFAIRLYRANECYVPPLVDAEVDSLDARCNPAFDFCEAAYWMALRGGREVGRIAAFVNRRFNAKYGVRECRFCFIDFVDDEAVSRALLDAARRWGQARGMTTLVGPLGLTDLDYEGCLIEGFDWPATIATIYNYPYYVRHFEAYGMRRDAVWNEYRMRIPDAVPERYQRIARLAADRYGLRVFTERNARVMVRRWGRKIFELLNCCYAPLYGFTELTDRQIDYYIRLYLPHIRLDCIRLVADAEDRLVAFGITCPSLSRAQQRAGGSLWPLGWWHMLRALHTRGGTDTWDLYLVGVHPDFQGKGVNALLFAELIPQARRNGYVWCESNPELETNLRVQSQWQYFERTLHKRRATFRIDI